MKSAKADQPSIEASLFSVGGGKEATGEKILEDNEFDAGVRAALGVAFDHGEFKGHNMEDIKLIRKQ